ncbi:hypothetical protein ACFQI7_30820 [Paenibacillus allorhizosphaerae]|uniref:Uncharacterized protein n=1 Tax=Paenibacillus allorhizosphaerae TaxID=2849866 RepID=A0ABM8VPQ1_9BACL|nr:hypothetical protein [Paenibacillus allorhizosphaerae]CAG7653182.1 hypothetical protein PAECIP111802_05420 [Paenibacillus allorhizosphaerae]
MVKKGIWLLMACLLVFGLIYGITWIGDAPVSAEISQEAKGQFVRVEEGGKKLVAAYEGTEKTYPIADNVWVYRNAQKAGMSDLHPGDTLEIILNSKSQAAYIKASGSTAAAAASGTPASSAAETTVPPAAAQPETPATSNPAPAAQTPPASSQAAVPQANTPSPVPVKSAGGWPWERLSLELKSRELVLKVKQEQTDKGSEADIYVQTKDRAVIHLNGAEAEQMLRLLTMGLPADRAAWEKALKARLGAEFKLKDASPDWKLDIRWKDDAKQGIVPAASQSPQSDSKTKGSDKEKEKDSGKGKEKEKEKTDDKGKGKGKGHDDHDHDD